MQMPTAHIHATPLYCQIGQARVGAEANAKSTPADDDGACNSTSTTGSLGEVLGDYTVVSILRTGSTT